MFYVAGVSAFFTTVLSVIAIFTSWDPDANYFLRGSILPVWAIVFAFLTAISGSVAAFFTADSANPFECFSKIPLTAIGFLLSGAMMLASGKSAVASGILLLLGAIYPLSLAFSDNKSHRLVPVSGFLTVLSVLLLNIYYYFDKTVGMNAPIKAYLEMFLVCAALWYVEGLRYALGNPLPRIYLMTGVWTASAASLAVVPAILSYFVWNMKRLDYLAGGILALFVLCDVVLRLIACLRRN